MAGEREVDVAVAPGIRYTEDVGRFHGSRPVRDCCLWQAGTDTPISDLNVVSFVQRFGGAAVPAEGIGGVETHPQYRRHGHVRTVLDRALAGIARRVPVVFVSEAIEELYEKVGCVTCQADAFLTLHVGNVERMAARRTPPHQPCRSFTPDDLPAMVALYNTAHVHRSWTHQRPDGWNMLRGTRTWQPGSDVIILERDGAMAGYAVLDEAMFGRQTTPAVDELAARDSAAAEALLVELAARFWRARVSEFRVYEPLDSAVGQTARRLGCEYQQTFPASGGMMGKILDRHALLDLLEPELQRRAPGSGLQELHAPTFAALRDGALVADDAVLLRLLLGYWSAGDARAAGGDVPEQFRNIFEAWFPGGSDRLPIPFAHRLDRY